MPKKDFQLHGKQKVFIVIIYLVSNSHQKGSEAAYTKYMQ